MATDAICLTDPSPYVRADQKLRRPPAPNRTSVRLSWEAEPDRLALVTDESDGGIGMNTALGVVPPHGTAVTIRYLDGEIRRATVHHVAPEGGYVHLGLAWTDPD